MEPVAAPPRLPSLLADRGVHPGPRAVTAAALPAPGFDVAPLSPSIGAEVDLDLRRVVDDELFDAVRRLLLEHKVLVFRDQRLDGDGQRRLAARWGELEAHPFLPAGSTADVVRFAKDDANPGYENLWHADVTWRERPAAGAVLRAVEVPDVGGDTLWADMAAAHDGLSAGVRERIAGLTAVHDFTLSFGATMGAEELAEAQARFPAVEHPVVRTHPETGRRVLFVNPVFTSHVVGVDPDEGEALLRLLFAQAAVPEYQCRLRWAPGTVAMWDNRSTQHYATNDYHPQRRVMERVAIVGDRPV